MLEMIDIFSGQLEQERNVKSGKLELLIDGVHYYILVSTEIFLLDKFNLKMVSRLKTMFVIVCCL